MLRIVSALLILPAFAAYAAGQTFYGTTDLSEFREGRDKEFRNKAESPLIKADFDAFTGLGYFAVDNRFRVAAAFVRTADEKYFQMPTSSGKTKRFVKFGLLKFRIGTRPYTLAAYQMDAETRAKFPEYADLLFIPFRDLTSGTETYSVGRYIDIRTPKDKRVTLDFNLAYNPNCAYGSDRYSCPIPPRENRLAVRITAGELNYKHTAK